MSSTCSLTVSLYILAVPWKLPTMVDGMPMRTRASSNSGVMRRLFT